VFVVGDMASLKGYPGVAQVAIQGARYAAEQIKRRLAGQPEEGPFEYHDKGSMATISRFSAVASIGRLHFSGLIAWVLWLAVHLVYIIGFKHRITTLLHWAVTFLGRGRPQRTITHQQAVGRAALHHLDIPHLGVLQRPSPVRADADQHSGRTPEDALSGR